MRSFSNVLAEMDRPQQAAIQFVGVKDRFVRKTALRIISAAARHVDDDFILAITVEIRRRRIPARVTGWSLQSDRQVLTLWSLGGKCEWLAGLTFACWIDGANKIRETPVCDGKHLVVYFGMMGLACYDLDGNVLWKKDLGNFPMQQNWGTSSSPVMPDNLVFVQVDNDQKSFLVSLDIATGVEKWRKDRDEASNWGSPIIWQNAKRTELITAGRTIRSYQPEDGSLLWQLTLNAGGVCSTPTGDSDVLIVGNQGRQGAGMMAVRAGATGDVSLKENEASNSRVLWSTRKLGPQRSSPLMIAGQVYLFGQRDGQLTCVDSKSGEVLYQGRIPNAGAFWTSP